MSCKKIILTLLLALTFPCLVKAQSVLSNTNIEELEQRFLASEMLLKEDLSDSERKNVINGYIKTGDQLAKEYIRLGFRGYDEAKTIYAKISLYASDKTKLIIQGREALICFYEGKYFFGRQEFEKALVCMEMALDGFRKSGSDARLEMAVLHDIGDIQYFQSDWRSALSTFLVAERLACQLGQEEDRMVFLSKLYSIYDTLGDSAPAEKAAEIADSLYRVTTDPHTRFVYNDFRGDQSIWPHQQFRQAALWYGQNEGLLPQLSNSELFQHYNNLMNLYSNTGQWNAAIRYAMLVKDNIQTSIPSTDGGYYLPYGDIASLYCQQRDSLSCFLYLDTLFQAIPYIEEPREIKLLYLRRALAFSAFGEYEKALADYQTADAFLASKYDETNGDRISLLPLIGGMNHKLGLYEESERIYRQYAEKIGSKNGKQSPSYVEALNYLANAEGFAGHIDSACSDYTEAASLLKRLVRSKWPYLTSQEREGYWNSTAELFLNMAPFALEAKAFQSSFTEDCYNGLILTKAFLLESEQSTFDLIKHHGTSEDLALYSSIQALNGKVQEWERNDYYTDSILQTTQTIRMLESRLADRCRAFGDATAYMDMDYRKIRQSLKDGDVLLDFTDFVSKSRGRVYAAYIVDNKQPYPLLKELFQERSIDSLEVTAPFQYYEDDCAERLVELLWKPLKEHVPEGAKVYYVPTQMLFQIALESLPAGDGTLLGNHYQFVRLSSARELARYNDTMEWASSSGRADAVLYGDLQYSLDGTVMAQEARKHEVSRLLAYRGDSDVIRSEGSFNPLPGTKDEIDYIEKELRTVGLSVVPYLGQTGTEESFLCLSGQAPIILHLATHGFYYTPDAAQNVDYLRGYRDAMSLSGLVLAGGNSTWQGKDLPEGVLDGIVTAADISRMDLSGVDMAVLSACHTGKGKATPEGLYGLQRAFKKASVRTIIMSLWAESDVVGPEFMAAFYKYLVEGKDKWNKRKAFDRAKTDIRNKYPKDPSLWAGFVMLD